MPGFEPDAIHFGARVRLMQIVAGALMLGIVVFAAVAIFLAPHLAGGQPDQTLFQILLGVSAFFLLQALVLGIVLPRQFEQSALQRIAEGTWLPAESRSGNLPIPAGYFDSDAGKLLSVRQSTNVIRFALFEGAAFTGLISYLLGQNLLGLIVPGLALGSMAVLFPTATGVQQWLESRLEQLQRMRTEAGLPAP